MVKDELILNWKDLSRISDLTFNEDDHAGVYMWGFTIDQNFIPYYVGIASYVFYRIYEHINSIIGGKYTIFHRDSLANHMAYKAEDVNQLGNKGKLYMPDWPYGYRQFLDNRNQLQQHIDFMIETFTFLVAEVDMNKYSKHDLKEIEKICITKIGKDRLINTRAGESNRFHVKHHGNATIRDIFDPV